MKIRRSNNGRAIKRSLGTVVDCKKLKASFIKEERNQFQSDFRNIKTTLEINKEIITNLLSDNSKMALYKLNEENTFLLKQIDLVKEQRDEYHKRYVITEQIVNELELKSKEDFKDYADTISELLEQLDKKEYAIQNIKYKCDSIVELARKYSKSDTELASCLKEFDEYYNEKRQKISTIIGENKLLSIERDNLKQKVSELEKKLTELEENERIPIQNSDKKDITKWNANPQIWNPEYNSKVKGLNDKLPQSDFWLNKNQQHFVASSRDINEILNITTCGTQVNIESAENFDGISVIMLRND